MSIADRKGNIPRQRNCRANERNQEYSQGSIIRQYRKRNGTKSHEEDGTEEMTT